MHFFKRVSSNADPLIWITLFTAVSYGLYYCMAKGKASYYHMPSNFIELDTKALATTSIFILLLAPFAWYYSSLFLRNSVSQLFKASWFQGIKNKVEFISMVLVLLFFLVFLSLKLNLLDKESISMGLAVVFLIFNFEIALYLRKYLYLVFSTLLTLVVLMTSGGWLMSESEDTYYTIKKECSEKGCIKDYVVLNIQKDYLTIAPVDLKKKVITPNFQLIETKSEKDNKVELKLKHTGELKVKKYAD